MTADSSPTDPETDGALGFVSVTTTKRRRHLWVAWWTSAPRRVPFVPPDACEGGARTAAEAHALAEERAGRQLRSLDGMWARAWLRLQKGLPAWVEAAPSTRPPSDRSRVLCPFAVLGVTQGASPAELKRAFRLRALETHPDRGGDVQRFLLVRWAYDEGLARISRR